MNFDMLHLLKKRWYIITIIIVLAGILYFAASSHTANKTVATYIVKKESVTDTLSISGQIDADEKVNLQFQTSGPVTWVGVKEGDYVKKGTAIASLDSRQLQKSFQKYMNTYIANRMSFDQTVEADNDQMNNAVTQTLRDAAKTAINSSQMTLNNSVLDVESNQIAIQYATLITPISGIVTQANPPYPGVNIVYTQAQYSVVNPATVYFSATADQTDVVKLKSGMTADISLDAFSSGPLPAQIYFIAFEPKSGETGTVYEVRMRLNTDNSNYQYRLGMTGDASFILNKINDAITVPTQYLKSENNTNYVLVLVHNVKVKRPVTTGSEIDGKTIVTSGLSEGDTVVE